MTLLHSFLTMNARARNKSRNSQVVLVEKRLLQLKYYGHAVALICYYSYYLIFALGWILVCALINM
jgi:hypothetical protein